LVAVHAHPDDECISTGGILARYAGEGVHVCLVTCTNGELGEVAELPGLGPPDTLLDRLGEIRAGELREACDILGVRDLRLLGYHDSGMDGTDGNHDPKAFVNQDMAEVTARLVAVLREVRPQVVVTYNEYGFYGHPDHIQAHKATLEALDAAADPAYRSDLGPPHTADKLYYTAVPRSGFRALRDNLRQGGLGGDEDRFSEEDIERIGTPDDDITTVIDVSPFVEAKFAALKAHRTQLGTTEWFFAIPSEIRALVMGAESYVLVRSTVPRLDIEQDLFEGLGT
jgi:N-acetyl-1-D-myo-inositol-2-amino-2-deoxy-alpha-D-glucopyranoside deacetylase